jgi:hypothetical protein
MPSAMMASQLTMLEIMSVVIMVIILLVVGIGRNLIDEK